MSDVLDEAAQAAGVALGLVDAAVHEIARRGDGALLVRCYVALSALIGGDRDAMWHWVCTHNEHLEGVPAEQVARPDGLTAGSRVASAGGALATRSRHLVMCQIITAIH